LNEEQRMEFRAILMSHITLAQAQQKALAWATGPEIGKKPSIACLEKSGSGCVWWKGSPASRAWQ